MSQVYILAVLFEIFGMSLCQIFQEVPIGMGMPMMMPMPSYQLVGNPFDQGIDVEYSPIIQLVSSIAHLVEMNQKSKDRLGEHEQSGMFPQELPAHHMRSRSEVGPRFNLIPYTHEGIFPSVRSSPTSRIVNSIPKDSIPPVMWRIGDLIGRNEKENVYDMRKIKGFPIVKSSDDITNEKLHDEGGGGEKENKSWTILEIARKILGVDEIPTASEGNAIAQLLEELKKDKRGDRVQTSN